METYIALLRGINVSGQKLIKMEALKNGFEDLGFKNVTTYIQSGNVVFQSKKSKTETLEKKIKEQILDAFSFDVAVTVLEQNELKNILDKNPFIKRKETNPKAIYVTILSSAPEFSKIELLKDIKFNDDEFIIAGRTIYLNLPGGAGNTKLTNNFFETKLKVSATTRNWNTINKLFVLGEKL